MIGGDTHPGSTETQMPADLGATKPDPADGKIADNAPDFGNPGRTGLESQRLGVYGEAFADLADQRTDVDACRNLRRQLLPRRNSSI